MEPSARKLPNLEAIRKTLARVEHWRGDPAVGVNCPLCEAPNLRIIDRSARPHAEWYCVQCAACGLDDVVTVAGRGG